MSASWDEDRLVAEVRRLGARGMPREDFHRELGARLRRAFPIDAACWHGLDPTTLLLTTAHPEELLAHGLMAPEAEPDVARVVLSSEYERDDFNAFAALARRREPVGILSEASRGRPERSARFAEWLGPAGLPFEMRAVFGTRGRPWGCVVFHRTEGTGDFTRREAALVARLARPIAEGVRRSVRADAARRAVGGDAPGMVVLGPRDELELATRRAQELLEALRHGTGAPTLPMPLLAVAARARAAGGKADPPSLHVPTPAGWLSFHAALPEGPATGRVAVIVQAASGQDAAPLRLEAYGLSAREQEISGLVAAGMETREIAQRLFLSPWTVRDHLKAIFDKTGVRSRRELRTRIFYDDHLPAMVSGAPLTAEGRLQPEECPRQESNLEPSD